MMNTGKTFTKNRPDWTAEGMDAGRIRRGKTVLKTTKMDRRGNWRIIKVSPWSKASFPVARNVAKNLSLQSSGHNKDGLQTFRHVSMKNKAA